MEDHKKIIVADASVLLKWIIKEEKWQEQAFLLKDQFGRSEVNIIVPSHCFAEICNILGRGMKDQAISFISYLTVSEIEEHNLTLNLASAAFGLMKKYSGISFYDAAYHALAIQEGGIFVTADEKYFRNTNREGRIILLKDYGS
jgi:predicted nucleic acid-binding protein